MPVRDYYDATKWNLGDEDRPLLEREMKALKYIASHNKVGMVLDVGCGDGLFMSILRDTLKDKKTTIWGVDYSEYKLKKAREQGHKVKQCDLEKGLPFKDNTFDVIYAAELIEHLYDPDFFLEECNRVLKKGGVVVISTPNLQAWYNRLFFLLGIQPLFYEVSTKSPQIGSGILKKVKKGRAPVGHVHVFNRAGLVDMLHNEGFRLKKLLGARFHSLPTALQPVDKAFNIRPSMASNLIAIAEKSE